MANIPILDTASGLVINVALVDQNNIDALRDSLPADQSLGPEGGQKGETFNGTDYDPAPRRTPKPSVIGELDAVQFMIDEGITTKTAVVARHPEWETRLKT